MMNLIKVLNNEIVGEVEIWNKKGEFITNKIENLNIEQKQNFITIQVEGVDRVMQKIPSKLTVLFSCTVLDVSLYSEFCELCKNWAALHLKIKQKRMGVIEIIKYGQWQVTTFVFTIKHIFIPENGLFTISGFINRQL